MKRISIFRLHLRERKIVRNKNRSKIKRTARNKYYRRNKQKKSSKFRENDLDFNKRIQRIEISANRDFTILEHPENVLEVLNRTTNQIGNNTNVQVEFDLSAIKKVDIGAIAMLLTKVNELSRDKIKTFGNLPDDEKCKKFFFDSGFLKHMKDLNGNLFLINNNNLLINRGFDKTSNKKVGEEIKKAVNHLTGEYQTYRPVYSLIQEMCANSIEHANEQNKNWLLGIFYEQDRVNFAMIDIGKGILGTLRKKAHQLFIDNFGKTDVEVLDGVFEKKYQSATLDKNRNKGLPKIRKASTENYVENLVVITNNVFLDFTNQDKSRLLNKKLQGTFYYWELTKESIEKWKSR